MDENGDGFVEANGVDEIGDDVDEIGNGVVEADGVDKAEDGVQA